MNTISSIDRGSIQITGGIFHGRGDLLRVALAVPAVEDTSFAVPSNQFSRLARLVVFKVARPALARRTGGWGQLQCP